MYVTKLSLFFTGLLLWGQNLNAQYPQKIYADNCGYSAVCAVFARLGVQAKSGDICRVLQLDQNHIRPLSFFELKSCLEKYGLNVVPVSGDIGEISEVINQSKVSILHIRASLDDHFVVLWKAQNSFTIYDHPRCNRLDRAELRNYLKQSSGNLLSVIDGGKSLDLNLIKQASLKDAVPRDARNEVQNAAQGEGKKSTESYLFENKCLIPLPEQSNQEAVLRLPSTRFLPSEFKIINAAGDCSCFRGIAGQDAKGIDFKFDRVRLYERIGSGSQPKIVVKYANLAGEVVTQKIIVAATKSDHKYRFESFRLDVGEFSLVDEKSTAKTIAVYLDGSQEEAQQIFSRMVPRLKCSPGVTATWKQEGNLSMSQLQYNKVGEVTVEVRATNPGVFVGVVELWDDAATVSPSGFKITALVK